MKSTSRLVTRFFLLGLMVFLMAFVAACNGPHPPFTPASTAVPDPADPWLVTATEDTWLTTNPFEDKHDGGWVYSAREDCIYAMYGNDDSGRNLWRIDPIGQTAEVVTVFTYGRHGSCPVIDNTGTYIYQPPSCSTDQLERYNTETDALETLATAPGEGCFSRGAWKDGKLWIVLDDNSLYSYDPDTDTWSDAIQEFDDFANVATSGPDSNLIYILVQGGEEEEIATANLFSYDVTTDTLTELEPHPYGFILGGNCEFTWFGNSTGFLYAGDGDSGLEPAIYDIASGTWQELSDPRFQSDYSGHVTFDSTRQRLYVVGTPIVDDGDDDGVWYYQY